MGDVKASTKSEWEEIFTNQLQSRRFYAKEDRSSIHNDKQPVNSETNPKVLPNDIKLFTGLLLLEATPLVGHSWTPSSKGTTG
jgi:hypothetical protein